MAKPAIASVLHNWGHDSTDKAKSEILGAVGDISDIEIFGSQVLVAPYIRPGKTRGGVIVPGDAAKEDTWQGKVGLILKVGPTAFASAKPESYGGRIPGVGDWVFHDVKDCFQMHLKGAGAKRAEGRDFDGWPGRLVYAADLYGRLTSLTTVV